MVLEVEAWVWIVYHLLITTFIIIDLRAGFKRGHELTFREAAAWSAVWIGVGVFFGIFVLYRFGLEASALYYAALALEKTLSMDNLFVFAVIFMYFAVPGVAQPVVLYTGIITAVIMRATFIYGGLWLLETFHWMVFIFGAVLLYSGIKIWKGVAENVHPERNPIVKWTKRFLPMADHYSGPSFFIRQSDKLVFTPLIVVLAAIESSDLMFAFDSIPAVVALTRDFFIAYTSNISAILGLRALYFLIAQTMFKFRYVGKGLAFILLFLGVKFFLGGIDIKVPTLISLAVVFGVLMIAIVVSVLKPKHAPS